jgi:hypothetical protein
MLAYAGRGTLICANFIAFTAKKAQSKKQAQREA